MNFSKLGLLAVMVVGLMALAGAAQASPLTSPEGTSYTSTIKAETQGSLSLQGAFTTISCKSTLETKVESHSSAGASGNISNLSFSECNYPVTMLKAGSLKIHTGETNPGTTTSSDAEITIHTSVGTCIFTTANTDLGTITDTNTTGGNAVLDLTGKLPRTGGNFLCGSSGSLSGSYKITTPSTLYVD